MNAPQIIDRREQEAYPGELAELRAVRDALQLRGCVQCQLRASMALHCAKQLAARGRVVAQQDALLRLKEK